MLSAFRARAVLELRQRDKSKIESVLAYGDRIFIGLNIGSLRIYRVNESTQTPDGNTTNPRSTSSKQRPVDLLREEENFSRRSIQQLAIIKEANILVSLSDGYVSIHDLQSYALQEKLEKTKGALSFAITSDIVKDQATGIPSIVSKLAVAVKRRIFIWVWQDMELSEEVAEFSLASTVKSLVWATADSMIAGMDPGFVVIDTESKAISDINTPSAAHAPGEQAGVKFGATGSSSMNYVGMGGWMPKPMATKVSEDEILLVKDVNTLFVDKHGKAFERRQVPWASAPEAVGYSYPYLLALQHSTKGILEVRNPETLTLLQSISLPNATSLYVPRPNISLAHAGKGFLVASERCVWQMNAQDYDGQIDELIAGAHFDEAISLLTCLEDTLLKDKEGRLRHVKILKAVKLFKEKKYRKALELFSEGQAPPKLVISFYPEAIAGDLTTVIESDEDVKDVDAAKQEGVDTAVKDAENVEHTPSKSSRFLTGKIRSAQKKTAERLEQSSARNDDTAAKTTPKEADQPDPEAEKKNLKLSVNELCAFLAQTRVHLQKYIGFDGKLKDSFSSGTTSNPESKNNNKTNSIKNLKAFFDGEIPDSDEAIEEQLRENAKLVDTTLFRAYMFARPGLAGSLFRIDNFCDPAVIRKKLYESERYADLVDFLHGKRLHREALELLTDFGKGRHKQESEEGQRKEEHEQEQERRSSKDVPESFRGPGKVVGYLQQLPPESIDLILEFVEWPLQEDPALGMEVFVADSENAEQLPRSRVLQFLERISTRLSMTYLEHLVDELGDATPSFHQRLIELYLQRYRSLGSVAEENDMETERERMSVTAKLEHLLRKSESYNKSKVYRQLPNDDENFYECQAIVLSRMGQHKQALQIYVFQLKDYDRAEEYCNAVYLQSTLPSSPTTTTTTKAPSNASTPSPHIYDTLLSLYLLPPAPHPQNWPPALALLSRHGARIPAPSTLDLVPESFPLADLASYFHGQIRTSYARACEEAVASRLRAVQKVGAEVAVLVGKGGGRLGGVWGVGEFGVNGKGGKGGKGDEKAAAFAAKRGRNRKVTIDEGRHCSVCHKRFGGSAVRVYPDNSVVHYGCGYGKGRGGGSGEFG